MGNDLHNLADKGFVRRDLVVPVLDKLAENDGYESIELQVDIVAAGQRREQVVNGRRCWSYPLG